MGIYDRDYYRREGPSYLDSFSLRGQATKWILFATVGVYIVQLLTRVRVGDAFNWGWAPGPVTKALALDTNAVMHGQIWRLVTYAFLHDENVWTHILFNMWMFWMFGGYVEAIYGRWEFLTFYLVSAFVGGLAYLATVEAHLIQGQYCVGASGAVTATMVLCALYHPRLTILLFFILPVPIWVLVALQVVQDLWGFMGGRANSHIAFSVHLGGAAFALLYYQTKIHILGIVNIGAWLRSWKRQLTRPRLRLYRGEDEEPRVRVPVPPSGREVDEQLEAKVDAVLEKVARDGKDSLTPAERELLLRASEIYKKRRT